MCKHGLILNKNAFYDFHHIKDHVSWTLDHKRMTKGRSIKS